MEALRRKSVEESVRDTEDSEHGLRRALGPIQLTTIGIGVVIGTEVFVLTGEAAGTLAGPAIAISFAVAAIVCLLAGRRRPESPLGHPRNHDARALPAPRSMSLRPWLATP